MSLFKLALPVFLFEPDLQEVSSLKMICRELLDAFIKKALNAGYAKSTVDTVLYAVVAWLDEKVVEVLKGDHLIWLSEPLQMDYFSENTAGQGFFDRLDALLNQEVLDHEVIECYLSCLELNFYGVFRGNDAKLEAKKAACYQCLNLKARSNPIVSCKDFFDRLSIHYWVIFFLFFSLVLYLAFIFLLKIQEHSFMGPFRDYLVRVAQNV